MGVASGPLSASLLRRMDSSVSAGIGVPWVGIALAPAAARSHSSLHPAASITSTAALTTSGPMPSPGMSVTRIDMGGELSSLLPCPRQPHGPGARQTATARRRAARRRGRRSKIGRGNAPSRPFALRYRPMQGDMDIVDPLIDDYLTRLAGSPDPVEAEMRRYADERDGFPIVGQTLGTLLAQYALVAKARRIFEVGSGFGYSAFWFARVLEPGSTVTLTDFDRENLDRARSWLAKAGLLDRCRFEPAGDGLEALARCEAGLDAVFLDGEKAEHPKALAIALPKLRAGGLVLANSVLWGGAVARGESDAATDGLREYTRLIFGSEGIVSTIVPIRDGLAITWKR